MRARNVKPRHTRQSTPMRAGAANPLFFDFAKVGAARKLSTALPLREQPLRVRSFGDARAFDPGATRNLFCCVKLLLLRIP